MSTDGVAPPRERPRIGVGAWLAVTIGALLALATAGIALALVTNAELASQRHQTVDLDTPADIEAVDLENALLNQETGVRGYLLSGEPRFLQPYRKGLKEEKHYFTRLGETTSDDRRLLASVQAVRVSARRWHGEFVEAALYSPRRGSTSALGTERGKALFDSVRTALTKLHNELKVRLATARSSLNSEGERLTIVLIIVGALILASVIAAGWLLRRIITAPLAKLGRLAALVAGGSFETPVVADSGAHEIVALGEEIESMRVRIVSELASVERARSQLEQQATELERSNADLEQFAYVASHDLQEPLRKVTSFCQALQRRYGGELDERADQYIEFAVDGAKRMQVLINDLLAFSRVGRGGHQLTDVDLGETLAAAEAALSEPMRQSGALVRASTLPTIRGEQGLLVSLWQNLISNALKFHGPEPPQIEIGATRRDDIWELSFSDNGIGIEPVYADRIFEIFQRLHTREVYDGTGIGLAMCRKIVEYHGGRLWLDHNSENGAIFRFTLPVVSEQEEA